MLKGQNKTADQAEDWSADRLSSVQESNRQMFDHQDGCDVLFTVKGPGDAVETRLGAHRYVLCSRSPVFHKTLQWGGKSGGEKKLKENEIPAEAFKEVIRFLYCDDAHLTVSNSVYVLQGSRKYRVTPLTIRCLEYIETSMTVSDVCVLLDQCLVLNEQHLASACLRFIEQNTGEVLKTGSFLKLKVDVLLKIITLDTLNVTELDLFLGCVDWAKRRCQSPLDTPDSSELRKHLEPLLAFIRFPTMTTQEFATHIVPLNVLTDAETCNIYKYFTCPEKPPKKFLTAKRNRPSSDAAKRESPPPGDTKMYPTLNAVQKFNDPTFNNSPDVLPTSAADYCDPPPKYE